MCTLSNEDNWSQGPEHWQNEDLIVVLTEAENSVEYALNDFSFNTKWRQISQTGRNHTYDMCRFTCMPEDSLEICATLGPKIKCLTPPLWLSNKLTHVCDFYLCMMAVLFILTAILPSLKTTWTWEVFFVGNLWLPFGKRWHNHCLFFKFLHGAVCAGWESLIVAECNQSPSLQLQCKNHRTKRTNSIPSDRKIRHFASSFAGWLDWYFVCRCRWKDKRRAMVQGKIGPWLQLSNIFIEKKYHPWLAFFLSPPPPFYLSPSLPRPLFLSFLSLPVQGYTPSWRFDCFFQHNCSCFCKYCIRRGYE